MHPETPTQDRRAALFVLAGAGTAIVSIPLAAAGGPPYLSLDSLSPWIVTYAVGLFRALLWWGAVAAGVLAASVVCGLPSGFDSDTLGGAVGIVGIADAALILATLVVWMLND